MKLSYRRYREMKEATEGVDAHGKPLPVLISARRAKNKAGAAERPRMSAHRQRYRRFARNIIADARVRRSCRSTGASARCTIFAAVGGAER